MRKFIQTIPLLFAVLAASAILAGARDDVRVRKGKDDKGNVVYKLTNSGDKSVEILLQHKKICSSTTSNSDPSEREHWLGPRGSKQIRKVMANSDCRHTYRVVKAEYF